MLCTPWTAKATNKAGLHLVKPEMSLQNHSPQADILRAFKIVREGYDARNSQQDKEKRQTADPLTRRHQTRHGRERHVTAGSCQEA